MQCPKCNKEFSDKVLPLHLKRCQGPEAADAISDSSAVNIPAINITETEEYQNALRKDLSKLKVDELKAMVKSRGVENVDQMKKPQLIECLMTPKEQ